MGSSVLPLDSPSQYLILKMNKLLLIAFGVLAIAAIVSAVDNEEDSSLSEELAYSRLVRSAGTRMKKGRKATQGKKARKVRKGRKAKKGRKVKKGRKAKNGKKARKAKKGKKAKKAKKGRKMKKGRKSQSGSRSNGRAVSDTCFEKALTIMKMWRDIIANFDRQSKRMEKQNGTGESKLGKKGVFQSVVQRLLHVGGDNKSALSCAGSTNNTGALQLKNLTDFLSACQTSVAHACNSTNFATLINSTRLKECETVTTTFKTGAAVCLGKSVGTGKTGTTEACTCWTNSTLDATVQAAKTCKFSDEANEFAAALKTCRNTFSECRKYEDDAANSISACSSNTTALKKKVVAISQNAAKVKEAKAVVKTIAASRRVRRTSTAVSCSQVAVFGIKLTALVLDFPSSPNVLVYAATIIASSSVTCSVAEKSSLAELDAMFVKAEAALETALDAAQEQLQDLTGATASSAEIASIAAETTVAATTVAATTVAATTGAATAVAATTVAANTTTVAANTTTTVAANTTTVANATGAKCK